jgi:hypothetical protein
MKKLLSLMLILTFAVLAVPQVAHADLLTDAGIDGGLETDDDDNDWPDGFNAYAYWSWYGYYYTSYISYLEEGVDEFSDTGGGETVPAGTTPDPTHFMELNTYGLGMVYVGRDVDYPIPVTEGTQYQASLLLKLQNPDDPTEYLKDAFVWKVEFFNVDALANSFPDGDRFDEESLMTDEDVQGMISDNGGWVKRRVTFTVPDKTPDVGYLVLSPNVGDWNDWRDYLFDGYELIEAAYAYAPSPAIHERANYQTVAPSWSNPPAVSVTNCVVEMSVDDANMIHPTELYDGSLASSVTHQDLVNAGIDLGYDKNYFWRVNYDGTPGDIWHFSTFNAIPDVTVDVGEGDGETLYTWLEGGSVSVQVQAGYTDDGRPGPIDPCDVRWTVSSDSGWSSPDPNYSLTPTITMTEAAGYTIQYSVPDGEETGTRSATINVSEDACGAAKADPDDRSSIGDFDGDCDEDLADFVTWVAGWLECMSPKLVGYSAPGYTSNCP